MASTLLRPAPVFGDARLPERFWSKVEPNAAGCWIWQAQIHENGYGMFRWDKPMRRAHRVAYAELVGPIPSGLVIDHLCRTRSCVNPAHLEVVTQEENWRRGESQTAKNLTVTECPKGHPYTEANTMTRTRVDGRVKRECRQCNRDRAAKNNRRGLTTKKLRVRRSAK